MTLLSLDGRTMVLGLLGDPIAQVKACQPLSELLQARGHNAVLVPLHVPASALPSVLDTALRVHNLAGFIATVPHKQSVIPLLADLLPMARAAGAVNVIRKRSTGWQGDLLDGVGFVDNLRAHGVEPAALDVAMAGAGGAGHAIAFALADAGAHSFAIHDVDPARAEALAARLLEQGYRARACEVLEPAPLLVNATPCGMAPGDPLPIPAHAITAGAVVADVIMSPAVTPLLELANARGARTVTGRGMMEKQLHRMADFFAEAIA